ncbi:hypothetical protein BV898_12320 [Hypsibius exemplaris]|uniref:Chromo domain-containing protein n=1 Tax=Hypsibius exemplaris TaxID=2072580 RepID=A0A1W0WE47_HYPEX|nr:hypothetical protein BV898_12320 [Hypsibius exemplaris]
MRHLKTTPAVLHEEQQPTKGHDLMSIPAVGSGTTGSRSAPKMEPHISEELHHHADHPAAAAAATPYWYVEEIRGVRVNETNDGLQYLVRWSGYAESHNSWESEKDCALAASKVRNFFARMPKDERDYFIPRMTVRFLSRLDTLLAGKKSAVVVSHSPVEVTDSDDGTDDAV